MFHDKSVLWLRHIIIITIHVHDKRRYWKIMKNLWQIQRTAVRIHVPFMYLAHLYGYKGYLSSVSPFQTVLMKFSELRLLHISISQRKLLRIERLTREIFEKKKLGIK